MVSPATVIPPSGNGYFKSEQNGILRSDGPQMSGRSALSPAASRLQPGPYTRHRPITPAPPTPDRPQPPARYRSSRDLQGLQISRINTARLVKPGSPWSYPLKKAQLPLCSFGPGGDYIVDWYPQNYRPVIFEDQTPPQPRGMGRLALLMSELRDWLLGIHPGRQIRSDSHPEHLEPCAACGHQDSWSPWLQGLHHAHAAQSIGPIAAVAHSADDEDPAASTTAPPADSTYPVASPHEPPGAVIPVKPALSVENAVSTPAPQCNRNMIGDRAGSTAGHPAAKAVNESIPFRPRLHLEQQHDTHSQTTGGDDRDPKLPHQAGLFADHAGIGRRTGRVQGDGIRARSGAVRKKAGAEIGAQGPLFDAIARGEAA